MAGRGGGAYINGRYVPAGKGASKGGGGKGGGGGRGRDTSGRAVGWSGAEGGEKWERKPGDEDVTLERKFMIDVLQPGESRIGYLFNVKPTRHYDDAGRTLAGMLLYFLQRDGRTFRCTFLYRPYFFVQISRREGLEQMRDILAQRFEPEGVHAEIVEREDLALEDHVIGKTRTLIKLSFCNQEGMSKARSNLQNEMKRQRKPDNFSFDQKAASTSIMDTLQELYEYDVSYVNRVMIDKEINSGRWFEVSRSAMATSIDDIWDTQTTVVAKPEMLFKPGLRVFAWDIECTKEPLKFPDSARDRITMISIMADGSGFLIVNRSEVGADIEPLEYTPKPEYEGIFETFNEVDEAALLRRFFTLIRETSPHVMVTFNGDFFDMPFVTARAKAYNMDLAAEVGLQKVPGEDYFAGSWMVHLDCFAWVQRDSYLPCGARGLKAVTRYKLKYDPVELDPEDMTPFAKERPQDLAAYSVSDAVATYYLYQKFIHDFIFALCSIIPYGPDDVLRKGSGTLCESLLMNQAFRAKVLFPNKHHDNPLEYHEGTNRLIEQSTYEGARVECMRVGIYRADIKETFQLEPAAFDILISDLKSTIDFYLVEEEKVKIEDVENYKEILAEIEKCLRNLCDPDKVAKQLGQAASPIVRPDGQEEGYLLKLVEYEVIEGKGGVKSGGKKVKKSSYRVIKDEFPLIYHLDVGAMYPNIILSNRLQPAAIVTKEFCNACSYNDPSNKCKRDMDWKWRGDLYMATRADVRSIQNEMENDKRRYNQKDRDTDEIKRVKWSELREAEQVAEIQKAVREFSQKAYRRVKSSVYEDKTDTVCQRENPFYVDTVRMFRDRRYEFKRLTKDWGKNLEKAEESGDAQKKAEAKDMVLLFDSLQLAHKCILNSFYGYVMRKGARWHSMKMAGIVTYTGSNLIREAREFCEQVGLPLELDTDGIWCLLPKSFPDTYKFKLKNGKELKMPYPNCVLNYRVHQKYTNHQYQTRLPNGEWKISDENSIFFEIDGPYKAMIIPASTEEDKMLKKRYAVFNFDGSLAELKGFEVKRRGELRLIQVFQTEVFPEFLKGSTKEEVYKIVGTMANRWLDVIESRGKTMTDDEVIYFFSESKSMSKSVESSGSHKSVQVTTAKRLAEFLGLDSMLKDAGISCHLFIANKPFGVSTTERAIPVKIFSADHEVKKAWLRQWLQDSNLNDFDMRTIIDWEYYKERLCAVFQKLISIPASYQNISNPCPRVKVPEWLRKRVAEQNDKFQQTSLGSWFKAANAGNENGAAEGKRKIEDIEDLGGGTKFRGKDLPLVEFGSGPRRWLEVQKLRWSAGQQAAAASGPSSLTASNSKNWRASLFDTTAAWVSISSEALRSTWQIIAIEPVRDVRPLSVLRVGDSVKIDAEADDYENAISNDPERGAITGFVGRFIRVMLESGEEQLIESHRVRPLKEEGLYSLWIAAGQTVHRCEVMVTRRVIMALESDFSPESERCDLRAVDMVKGLQVWPKEASERRVGPGVITSCAPEVGLCGVTWANSVTEAVLVDDLTQQYGSAKKVIRDAPRNLQHACLVEIERLEEDFQRQREHGVFGDRQQDLEKNWPRVDAVYEAEQPLEFDLISRLGSTVKLVAPERVEDARNRSTVRISSQDLQPAAGTYLAGFEPARNVYVLLCFDKTRPSLAFCGIYAPSLPEARACYGGLDPAESDRLRPRLEQMLSDHLSQVHSSLGEGGPVLMTQVSFVHGKSMNKLVAWLDQQLQEIRRRDGGNICVLCSQLTNSEIRGLTLSTVVDQRHLRNLTALREIPLCRAPFGEADSHFPALDWPSWITRRFSKSKVPNFFLWWKPRLALCRASGLPICNAPEKPAATVPAALDVLYSRQLHRDSQLRWASPMCRPDLGEQWLTTIDEQEMNVEAVNWLLNCKDIAEGRAGGQINNPGVYRSVCMEVKLRTKLCIAALQHARHLSDMEGGELSKKLIRKVNTSELGGRNVDHTSEVSITSFESLITMVQDIVAAREAREAQIRNLRQVWASQCPASKNGASEVTMKLKTLDEDDDEAFVQAMEEFDNGDQQKALELQDLRMALNAQTALLDGLFRWIASPSSLLYDSALLRKVHHYMDKVLQLLIGMLKRNGCTVIHASYTKVVIATGKLRVLPDIQVFWESLRENLGSSSKVLQSLALHDESCVGNLYYGMMWMDPSNWSGVSVSVNTFEVLWKVANQWQIFDFLPLAVRPALELYSSDLLLVPQQELGRRHGVSRTCFVKEPEKDSGNMEVDHEVGGCMDVDEDCVRQRDDADNEEEAAEDEASSESAAAAAVAAAAAAAVAEASKGQEAFGDSAMRNSKILEELRDFIREDFFDQLWVRVIRYISDLQVMHQRELAGGLNLKEDPLRGDGDSSGEEENRLEAKEAKAQQLRRHVEMKWSFPDMPGRHQRPGAVEFEFMRTLVQTFQLEACLVDKVEALKDRMCQKLGISPFKSGTNFENPCVPLILRDVVCPMGCETAHVDVTAHPSKGPGLWVCRSCGAGYDKDAMQGRLTALLFSLTQAWQSQEVTCKKCRKFRMSHMQNFCDCFGQFEVRFRTSDFQTILTVMRSLVVPHDLPWLGEMLDMHEQMLC